MKYKSNINENKVCLSLALLHVVFSHQEKTYRSITKISIFLFLHFHFFRFISTQFADFAFVKIQMEITFAAGVCFKQRSLVIVANKHFDCSIILQSIDWIKFLLRCVDFLKGYKRLMTAKEIFLCFFS